MVLLVALRELVRMAGAAAPAGSGSSSRQWHQAVGSTGDLRARAHARVRQASPIACSGFGARMNALPIQWGNFPFHTHDTVKSELFRNVQTQ